MTKIEFFKWLDVQDFDSETRCKILLLMLDMGKLIGYPQAADIIVAQSIPRIQ